MHAELGALRFLSSDESVTFWERVQQPVSLAADRPLWRLHLPASQGAGVAVGLAALADVQWQLDWAGSLLWIATDLDAATIRKAAEVARGHATLVRAPAQMRTETPALHPPAPGIARIERKVREAFDPKGVFASARFGDDKVTNAN
jgi:glycolate oxidase FAD binding subunit